MNGATVAHWVLHGVTLAVACSAAFGWLRSVRAAAETERELADWKADVLDDIRSAVARAEADREQRRLLFAAKLCAWKCSVERRIAIAEERAALTAKAQGNLGARLRRLEDSAALVLVPGEN